MQTFDVDQPNARQPLFGGGGRNGWSPQQNRYQEMSHGGEWDHRGSSSGIAGWWQGLAARHRTRWKWVVGIAAAVILIVVIAGSVGGTKGKGGSGSGDGNSAAASADGGGPAVSASGQISGSDHNSPAPSPQLNPFVPPPGPSPSSAIPPTTLAGSNLTSSPSPTGTLPSSLSSSPECSWAQLYLPKTAQPARYNLTLNAFVLPNNSTNSAWSDPALDNTVQGNVHIAVRLNSTTNCLVLHGAQNMSITSAAWHFPNRTVMNTTTWQFNNTWEQLTVKFPQLLGPVVNASQPLPVVSATGWSDEAQLGHLVLTFNYTLQEGLDGFYVSRYNDSRGVSHTIAATQFESIAARQAFPCWDEPHLKAPFSVAIAAHPNATVLSNTLLDTMQPAANATSGLALHTFKATPPMSTYLVAWVIGDLTNTSVRCTTKTDQDLVSSVKDVPVGVYISPQWSDGIRSTPDIACNALQQLTRTFGVNYTLDKLDLVGLPNFAAGAMENWGLITFREDRLLYNQADQDGRNQLDINLTIAHEITHQWFGNLVTCSDWTDLWLNEGFATYFENIGAELTSANQKEGLLQYFFFPDTTAPALMSDAVSSTHAIASTKPLTTLTQADSLFDDITYKKGAAVLRMLRMYLSLVVSNATSFTPAAPNNAALTSVPAAPAPLSVTPIAASVQRSNLTDVPVRKTRRLMTEQETQAARVQASMGEDVHADLAESLMQPRQLQEGTATDDYHDDANPAQLELYQYSTWKTEPFLAALKTYLTQFSFQAVSSSQLWDTLKTSGLPIDTWMGPWTWNSSYPVIQVQSVTPAGPGNINLTLEQRPMLNGTVCGDLSLDNKNRQWWMPVLATSTSASDGTLQAFTMNTCTANISLAQPNSTAPVLLNAGRYGLYHVNYTDSMWSLLINQSTSLTSQNLAGLLSDAFRLTELQDLPLNITIFLQLAETMRFRSQSYYAGWSVLSRKLVHIHQLLSNAAWKIPNSTWPQCHSNYMSWVSRTFDATYTSLGFNLSASSNVVEPLHRRLTRPVIGSAAGLSGAATIINTAMTMINSTGYFGVHPDIRGTAACLYVQGQLNSSTDDPTEQARARTAYNTILQQFNNISTLPLDKQRLLSALSCTRLPDLQDQFLASLTSPAFIQSGDVGFALQSLAAQGGEAYYHTWNQTMNSSYFEQQLLLARWPQKSSATYSLGLALLDMSNLFVDNSYDELMQTFYTSNQELLDPTFVAAYQEHTTRNINWLNVAGQQLCSFMAASQAAASATPSQ